MRRGQDGKGVRRGLARSLVLGTYRRLKPWLENLERAETVEGAAAATSGVSHFPTFLCRLMEETARAERHHLELGLVIFHLPLSVARGARRTEIEVVLRDCLRASDVPGRVADDLLAVLLPETGRRAPEAALRIARLLSEAAGTRITAGYARYPQDGQRVSELLSIATERATGAAPADPPLPEKGTAPSAG